MIATLVRDALLLSGPWFYEVVKAAIPAPARLSLLPFAPFIRKGLGLAWERRIVPFMVRGLEKSFRVHFQETNVTPSTQVVLPNAEDAFVIDGKVVAAKFGAVPPWEMETKDR